MKCNAGRNYMYISHKGEICRCTHRNHEAGEVIGNIDDFDGPLIDDFSCGRQQVCSVSFLGDWNRSSRFDENGNVQRGEFSVDPNGELSTKLNLTGICNFSCHYCHPERLGAKKSEEKNPEQWISFLKRLRKHYRLCHHYIQGTIGEPCLYFGIERVVETILELGDKVTIISNFYDPEKISRIADMAKGRESQMTFGASLHMTDPKFEMEPFFQGVDYVKKSGVYVEVLYVTCPTHIFMDDFWKKRCDQIEVPFRRFYASMQPETEITKGQWERLHGSSKSQTTVYESE